MARNGLGSGDDKASNREIGRRGALKKITATGIGGLAGIAGLSRPAAAYVADVGDRWTKGEQYHAEDAYYPHGIAGDTMPVDSTLDIAVEKTGGEVEGAATGEDYRIHEVSIEVLATSAYDLWDGHTAQQMNDFGITVKGKDDTYIQTFQDADIGFVASGPVRDASKIDKSAEEVADHSELSDVAVGLSKLLVGQANPVAGLALEAGSLLWGIANGEQESNSTSYWWDYSVPEPPSEYLNPMKPEYERTTQTYAATIYLEEIRVAVPKSQYTADLHVEPTIEGYGLNSSLPFEVSIHNYQGYGL